MAMVSCRCVALVFPFSLGGRLCLGNWTLLSWRAPVIVDREFQLRRTQPKVHSFPSHHSLLVRQDSPTWFRQKLFSVKPPQCFYCRSALKSEEQGPVTRLRCISILDFGFQKGLYCSFTFVMAIIQPLPQTIRPKIPIQ